MAADIPALLEKAKVIHRLPSDYKLALVMGISHSALTSYRQGKTLPDARVISLICDLTGDDPALLAVQIEEQRAHTVEARAVWAKVAQRLQASAAAAVVAVFLGVFSVLGLFGFSDDAHASASLKNENFSSYTSWKVVNELRKLGTKGLSYLRALTCHFWQTCRLFQVGPRAAV